MTCIIGYRDIENDCVWIGADSLGSTSYTKSVNTQPKVFNIQDMQNVIVGSTSTFRHIDLLKYSLDVKDIPDIIKNNELDHKFVVTQLIPKIMNLFQNSIVDRSTEDRGGAFLIGINNKLYEIQTDYSVLEPELDFAVVGCGTEIAMGSLLTTKHNTNTIKHNILMALRVATQYSTRVQAPYALLNTKGYLEIYRD